MCGMKIVTVGFDDSGNVNIDELTQKAIEHKDDLAALMITCAPHDPPPLSPPS